MRVFHSFLVGVFVGVAVASVMAAPLFVPPQIGRVHFDLKCTRGRTVKIPVLEAYGWDGKRRDMGFEWISVCEAWR